MSNRIIICQVADLPQGACKVMDTGTKVIAVFHHDGGIHAIDDFCPHMGAALSGGHVENGHVHCPWHAWRFRLCDGAWADNPKLKIASYPVVIENGVVQVDLGVEPNSLQTKKT